MASQALLKHLIQVANKSGAIIPAPHGLIKLKEQLDGVPFQLLVPSMSGVVTPQNLLNGILGLAKQLGGLQNVGDFSKILSQVSKATQNPNEAIRVAAAVGVDALTQAVGEVTSLTASLSNYG